MMAEGGKMGRSNGWKMRKWCWRRLEEEWKNWQRLVMTVTRKTVFFFFFFCVRQSFSMKQHTVEVQKHKRQNYLDPMKHDWKAVSKVLQLAGHKAFMTCMYVQQNGHKINYLVLFSQKNLRCKCDSWQKSCFTESTDRCGPASWMHTMVHRASQGCQGQKYTSKI